MNNVQGSVLVGIDGSQAAERAVAWAAAEAGARRLPMHLVFALGGVTPVQTGSYPMQSFYEGIDNDAREHLDSATTIARSIAPEIRMTTAVPNQPPVPALVRLSAYAHLVVLGSSGTGGFAQMVLGSVAANVPPRAHGPVVVVRGRQDPQGPIVLGVDDGVSDTSAIDTAFDRASQAQCPLTAVHATADATPDVTAQQQPGCAENPSRYLAAWSQRFPDVQCETITAPQRPDELLLAWSQRARLVVVGSRGRGGFRGMLLGSTSQALLKHADCPVLVARTEKVSAQHSDAARPGT